MDRVEDEFDKMLDDLNAVNDDFVNSYFEEDKVDDIKKEILENENIDNSDSNKVEQTLNEKDEPLIEEKPKTFSYNEILDRLDKKEKLDLNNTNDILELIETTNSSTEFFKKIEEAENDK